MAAPAPRPTGKAIPPALLQQMMAQHAPAQMPPQAQPSSPPQLPPQVMAQLMAQKQAQAQQGQGAAPPPQGMPPQARPPMPQGSPTPGGNPMPAGIPTPQAGSPQGGQPQMPPQPQSPPQPPGPIAGQQAIPPQGGLQPPDQHPQSQPGQMPPQMPPAMMQQILAQRQAQAKPPMPPPGAGGNAMGGSPMPQANPPQLPPQVVQQMAQRQAQPQPPQAPPGQGNTPNIPPAVMQQMQAAKQAIATGQPLPPGPVPPDVLQKLIGHAALLGNQVAKTGLQPTQMNDQQLEQAGIQHAALAAHHANPQPQPSQAQPGLSAFAQAASGKPATPPDAHAPIATQAKQGVGGDKIMAHLTPGEIEVPPALQNPQLIAALRASFAKGGADIRQFTAGSGQSSINPKTGKPQYDFLSAILPVAAMAATAVFAPELLPEEAAWAVPLVVGAAGAATSLATGSTWQQAAFTGIGGAAGGYMGGLSGGAASAADSAAADAAAGSTIDPSLLAADGTAILPPSEAETAAAAAAQGAPLSANSIGGGSGALSTDSLGSSAADAAHYNPETGQLLDSSGASTGTPWDEKTMTGLGVKAGGGAGSTGKGLLGGITNKSLGFGQSAIDPQQTATLGQALSPVSGGLLGASLGAGLGATTPASLSNSTQLPAGFTTPKPPVNPNFGSISGSGVQSTPTFQGYNPYQSVTGVNPATGTPAQAGYSFFPQAGQSPIAQNGPIINPSTGAVINPTTGTPIATS